MKVRGTSVLFLTIRLYVNVYDRGYFRVAKLSIHCYCFRVVGNVIVVSIFRLSELLKGTMDMCTEGDVFRYEGFYFPHAYSHSHVFFQRKYFILALGGSHVDFIQE